MRAMLVAVAMLTATMASAAEAKCLSRSEARTMWPGAYLFWYRDSERRRCWSNRRGKEHRAIVRTAVDRTREPTASPPPTPLSAAAVDLMAELMRKPAEPPPFPDVSAWDDWVARINAEPEVIYSTFAGEPPDEWPVERPPALAQIWMLAATLAASVALLTGLVWHWRALP